MNKTTFKDIVTVVCKHGFVYQVDVEHSPELGISIAYYKCQPISHFQYGRWLLPRSDDDREWEEFQERFFEGPGGDSLAHFELDCKPYFNKNY